MAGELAVAGVTADDYRVVTGAFWYYESAGIPLDLLIVKLRAAGCMPCWQDLIRSAVRNGARRDKFVRALVFAIKEVLGQEFASNVESRLLQADQESSTVPT